MSNSNILLLYILNVLQVYISFFNLMCNYFISLNKIIKIIAVNKLYVELAQPNWSQILLVIFY